MSAATHDRFAAVLTRIASLNSTARVRSEDAERARRNGDGSLDERLDRVVTRLESVADELEGALKT